MRVRVFLVCVCLFLLFFASATSVGAERIILKDGTVIEGKITAQTSDVVIVELYSGGKRRIKTSDIERIEKDRKQHTTYKWRDDVDALFSNNMTPKSASTYLTAVLNTVTGIEILQADFYAKFKYDCSLEQRCSILFEKCPNGHGRIPTLVCPRCMGRKYILDDYVRQVTCPRCGGYGFVICPKCRKLASVYIKLRQATEAAKNQARLIAISLSDLSDKQKKEVQETIIENPDFVVGWNPVTRPDSGRVLYSLVSKQSLSALFAKLELICAHINVNFTEPTSKSADGLRYYETTFYNKVRLPFSDPTCIFQARGEIAGYKVSYAFQMNLPSLSDKATLYPATYHLCGMPLPPLIEVRLHNNGYSKKGVQIHIESNSTFELTSRTIELNPDEEKMVRISPNLSEKALFSNTAFTDTVRVYIGISSKPIRSEIRKSWPLSVAPKYDCPWYRYGEIILGGWITPLDKDGLVMKAIERANQTKGFAGFCGYQSENPKERRSKVIQQIMILYDYFARQGIKYLNSTLSFESAQRIRPPAEVIRTKSGNCIELTLLFASCLEAVGLRTHIVLIPNHAFLAVSTKNSNYDSLSLDKDLLFLECTCIGGAPFEKALEVGEINFNKNRKIIFEDNRYGFLLVEKLREYNYRPNPNF